MRRPPLRVLLLLLAGLVAACDPATVADALGEPVEHLVTDEVPETIRYVALGDSIAVGTGSATSYVDEYAGWLEDETGSTVVVTNRGVNGWTTQDVLDELRDDEVLRDAVADAHLVTLNAGGNDLLGALGEVAAGRCGGPDGQRCLREAVERMAVTWDELLAELSEVTEDDLAGVRVLDLYRPALLDLVGAGRADLEHHLADANEQLVASAQAAGIRVGRVHDAFARATVAGDGTALVAPDLIHPTDRGHRVIAEELAAFGIELRAVE